MYDFTNVDPVKCCTWLVLPTVYDESLSYGEQLNKFCKALNELIQNNNNIPDYVAEMIQNYITSGAIDEVVRNVLASYILNVKYPPKGITPAVGDGSADDTEAIQGCIDYAFNQGGGCVYLPYGKYLSRSLTLRSGVSLIGFDRYSTRIVQRGGDTKPLVSGGNVQNVQISNLTLDGNNEVQTDDLDVVNILGKDVLLNNLVVKSGYQCLVYNGLGGDLQVSNVVFGGAVKKVAVINGKDSVQFENVKFNELGKIQGECVLEVGASDGIYKFSSKAVTPVCINVSGNRNSFICDIINATNNFNDSGVLNNFNILGVEVKEQLANGKSSSVGGSITENVSGSKTETITENKVENITGNREIDIDGTDSIHVDGVSSVNIGGARTEVYGDSRNVGVTGVNTEEYHNTMTETFNSKHNVNGTDETNTFTGNVNYKANKFSFNSAEKSLPITFPDKIVDLHNLSFYNSNYYAYFFAPFCDISDYTCQGTCLIDDNTAIFSYSDTIGNNTRLHKVNLSTGNIEKANTIQAYHANSLTFYDNKIYSVNFYENNNSGYSNIITVISPISLEIIDTIAISELSTVGIRSACVSNNVMYICDRSLPGKMYSYDLNSNVLKYLFTFPFTVQQTVFVDKELNFYLIPGAGNNIYIFSENGKLKDTLSFNWVSSDSAICNVEYQNMMQLSDGTLLLTDIGWKETVTGRFNRHIIASINKQIAMTPSNDSMRWDTTSNIIVSNSYKTYQNGTTDFPYDSLDYAGKIGIYGVSQCHLSLNSEHIEQFGVFSSNYIYMSNGEFDGLVLTDKCTVRLHDVTINNSCANLFKTKYSTNSPCIIYMGNNTSLFADGLAKIDGGNLDSICGVYVNVNCECACVYNSIVNTSIPIYYANASRYTYYGGYLPYTSQVPLLDGSRVEQPSYNMRGIGNGYGMRTKHVALKLGNISTITFDNSLIYSPRLSITIVGYNFVYDLINNNNDYSTNCTFNYPVSDGIIVGKFNVTLKIVDSKVTLTFSNSSAKKSSATAITDIDTTLLDVTNIRLF